MSTPVTPHPGKQLRERTDQPMGLCKQALDQNAGNLDKAIEWLRSQNSKMGVKREGNETAEGRIGAFFDNTAKAGAIVEVRCESAPSAKSDQFIALANDLAKHVAAKKPATVAEALAQPFAGGSGTVQDRINDAVGVIREKMILHKFQRLEGGIFGSYVHHDGSVGVLLECKGTTPNDEVLRDVSAHIAALNPPYTTVDFNLEYSVTRWAKLFVAGRNLTNAQKTRWRVLDGAPDWSHFQIANNLGMTFTAGVTGEF